MSASRVLFDTPGPRGRRRIRIITVAVVLGFAAVLAVAVRRFADHGELTRIKWQPFAQWPYLHFLLGGLELTLRATAVAAAIAVPFGALLALGRLARSPVVRRPVAGFVELFRSVPLLLVIYLFLLALPRAGLVLPVFWQLVLPIVVCNAAVLAEVFRAGVRALDRGQSEAAQAIGLRHWQAMRLVVLPQAVRMVVPALVTQLVNLLKDTTLGYVVSYPELMNQGKTLGTFTHDFLQSYLVVATAYILINALLSHLAQRLERRQRRTRPRRAAGQGDALPGGEVVVQATVH